MNTSAGAIPEDHPIELMDALTRRMEKAASTSDVESLAALFPEYDQLSAVLRSTPPKPEQRAMLEAILARQVVITAAINRWQELVTPLLRQAKTRENVLRAYGEG